MFFKPLDNRNLMDLAGNEVLAMTIEVG